LRYLGFLAATVAVYLVVVEVVKEKLMRRLWPEAR
jgi:succinate-acetate transporter protein